MQKIISTFLINSFLLQILLTSFGCKSFYPPDDENDLRNHVNSNSRLLIKLNDNSEFELDPGTYLYVDKPSEFIYGIAAKLDFPNNKESKYVASISKGEIVSFKETLILNLTTYQRYLLKDSTSVTFEKGKMYTATPDLGGEYWIVLDHKRNELRKIINSDIDEIQVKEINWVSTSILLTLGIGFIAIVIAVGQSPNLGSVSF